MGDRKQTVLHEDTYKRINYLYQAAQKCLQTTPTDLSLCRYYVYTLRTITKRLTLHMHPSMKRTMCGRCCVLLIPGVTAIIRHRSKRQNHTVVTCLECGTLKRYIDVPDKLPWIDQDESWLEIVKEGVLIHRPQNRQKGKKGKQQQQKQNNDSVKKTDTSKQKLMADIEQKQVTGAVKLTATSTQSLMADIESHKTKNEFVTDSNS